MIKRNKIKRTLGAGRSPTAVLRARFHDRYILREPYSGALAVGYPRYTSEGFRGRIGRIRAVFPYVYVPIHGTRLLGGPETRLGVGTKNENDDNSGGGDDVTTAGRRCRRSRVVVGTTIVVPCRCRNDDARS